MRKRTGKNDAKLRAVGMTRRKFREASAAGVALLWMVVPVGTRGAGVADALPTGDTLAQGVRTPPTPPSRGATGGGWIAMPHKKASRAIWKR